MPHLVFIHGIANKPTLGELLHIWRRTLGRDEAAPGVRLAAGGVSSSMVYWADVMYPQPDPDLSKFESGGETGPSGIPAEIEAEWQQGAGSPAEREWMQALSEAYGLDAAAPAKAAPPRARPADLEGIPLPWAIKRPFMRLFVRDTHHYLFNTGHSPRPGISYRVRDEIRTRFVATVGAARASGTPVIVVAHSQGTVVAYDCLKNVPDCPEIDGLITLGSPLGIDEVQEKLAPGWSRRDGFPSEKLRGPWFNIFDPADLISLPDPRIANDFMQDGKIVIRDMAQTNRGLWRHAMTEYLSGPQTRAAVRELFAMGET